MQSTLGDWFMVAALVLRDSIFLYLWRCMPDM